MELKKNANINNNFYCKNCNYNTNRKSSYEKHLTTLKHLQEFNIFTNNKFICNFCQKNYNTQSGLWKHKKKCNIPFSSDMMMELLKQNTEFQKLIFEQNKQMMEMTKNSGNNIMNNSHNNTINNKFNLNVFLNETCKDAMNITDFVNTLQITAEDVENVGKVGYVEGISKIIVDGLKQLDICKRPIHCSDLKREVTHIKLENGWEKENEDKPILIQAIKDISHKNIKSIVKWKNAYPEYKNSCSKKSELYMKIMGESMGACDKEGYTRDFNKIIKNVAKNVSIDKS